MRKMVAVGMGVLLLFGAAVGAEAASKMVRMSDKSPVELGRVVEDIGRSDVIFIGDTHDDSLLHARQLEIIRALHAKNPRLAIGLELFTADAQPSLDSWCSGKLDEEAFVAIYAKNWSYDWSLYRDIFIFARDNKIPMIALNVPKAIVSKVVKQGAASLDEVDRMALPPGSPSKLNPRQAEYLRLLREVVFGRVPARFPVANFEEAQALRNETMAYGISNFRQKSPQRKVVVIAGTWHSIRNGVPESLKKLGNSSSAVILPNLKEFAWLKPTAEDVDYLLPADGE